MKVPAFIRRFVALVRGQPQESWGSETGERFRQGLRSVSQRLLRADGETLELESIDGCEAMPGDRLLLETPGGGGWGGSESTD